MQKKALFFLKPRLEPPISDVSKDKRRLAAGKGQQGNSAHLGKEPSATRRLSEANLDTGVQAERLESVSNSWEDLNNLSRLPSAGESPLAIRIFCPATGAR